ncbi:MAG: DUF5989 family protein [bacterium]|nr:DUF5989 family protein [bacterium]
MEEKKNDAPQATPPAADPEPEDEAPASLLTEFIYFLKENKKWWLLPLILMFLLLGTLIMLSASPLAPFIYSFF